MRYNPARILDPDFTNAKDLFIHGMIDDSNGGTCASMPVLYTAVARRLGYPVRLVTTKGHVFCRWDTPGDRVNIEGASRGMHSYDDEYYTTWPLRWTEEDHRNGYYLRSLTRKEEMAMFLDLRGHCLQDTGHRGEALACYSRSQILAPDSPDFRPDMGAVVARRPGGIDEINRRNMERWQRQLASLPDYSNRPPPPTNINDLASAYGGAMMPNAVPPSGYRYPWQIPPSQRVPMPPSPGLSRYRRPYP